MNATTTDASNAHPIVLEVHDRLLANRVGFRTTANDWQGLDFHAGGHIVRLAMDDGCVRVYVFDELASGQPGSMLASALFVNMSVAVVVATATAYLAR